MPYPHKRTGTIHGPVPGRRALAGRAPGRARPTRTAPTRLTIRRRHACMGAFRFDPSTIRSALPAPRIRDAGRARTCVDDRPLLPLRIPVPASAVEPEEEA